MSTEDKEERAQVALAAAVAEMRSKMPAILEYAELQAKLSRGRYLALIRAGFSEEQALRLCTQEIKL